MARMACCVCGAVMHNRACFAAFDLKMRIHMQDAGEVRMFLTARAPPSPAAVQGWLETLMSRQAHTSQPASPASFGMNPNTGALLPGNALSQDSLGGAHESDLLGTPLFQSPPPNPGSALRARARSRLASASQPGQIQVTSLHLLI